MIWKHSAALAVAAVLAAGPSSASSGLAVGQGVYIPQGTKFVSGSNCATFARGETTASTLLEGKVIKLLPCGGKTYAIVRYTYLGSEYPVLCDTEDLIPG